MEAALKEWSAHHAADQQRPPASDLEREIAAIRAAVFTPAGSPIYTNGRWNAFSWPSTVPPFIVVDPEVRVVQPGGESRLTLFQGYERFERVLFVNTEQVAVLATIMNTLGGTARRQPGHVMETPNQPIGPSLSVLAFLNKFFPARPGHWGGWEFETYPVINRIEFLNRERSRAAVAVTVGYSGATVVLEKKNGRWEAVDLVNMWVT
jgi:hypothetical protein